MQSMVMMKAMMEERRGTTARRRVEGMVGSLRRSSVQQNFCGEMALRVTMLRGGGNKDLQINDATETLLEERYLRTKEQKFMRLWFA